MHSLTVFIYPVIMGWGAGVAKALAAGKGGKKNNYGAFIYEKNQKHSISHFSF